MSHKLFDTWTWNRILPEPFNSPTISPRSTTFQSVHNFSTKKEATLHAGILSALQQMFELYNDPTAEEKGAIGCQGEFQKIVEYPSRTGELQVVVFNTNTGKYIAGRFDDASAMPKPYVLKETQQSGTALFFALINVAMDDEEFKDHYNQLCNMHHHGYPDLEQAAQHAYILCDNLYRRIAYADKFGDNGINVAIPSTGNIQNFTTINLNKGVYTPDSALFGKFKVFTLSQSTAKANKKMIDHKDFVGQYQFQPRTFSVGEQELIPELPSWYVVPEEMVQICKHAQMTTEGNRPMRNFLLRGDAGTGKTEGAKAIAAGLGLPYVHLTCSANTEIFDILGQMMPVTNPVRQVTEYPTFEDIRMDASTAYFKLTGEYNEDISEDAVYEKLLEVIASNAKVDCEEPAKQQFEYVESPLIKAMRNGYVIEVQEPTVISNPGVLVGLNSLLDTCGAITLPTGERVTRHPDTVVVITTNVSYEGCRALNQSILSRMDFILDMEEPDLRTVVKRVLGITGCKDKDAVKQMAKIIQSIQETCRKNMIDDGCCGVRELISWVQSYMVCGDISEAARYTILPSVSADPENREMIQTACLDPVLGV